MKHEATPLFIGVNGSPRKRGSVARALDEVLAGIRRRGGRTRVVHLADAGLKPYHGVYGKAPDPNARRLLDLLLEADGFVLATPVYWASPSGLMKNFLDNLTHLEVTGFRLEGKLVGLVATCDEDGAFSALSSLAAALNHMGAVFPPYALVFRNKNARRTTDTEWTHHDFDLLGKNLMELSRVTRAGKPNWDYEKRA